MSIEIEKHRRYLSRRHAIRCDASTLESDDVSLLERYGAWLFALTEGYLSIITPAQQHFVDMHAGTVPATTAFEHTWRRYQRQRIYEKAKELERQVENFGYWQVVRLFEQAATLGLPAATSWLIAEGQAVPNKRPNYSLSAPEIQVPVSRHLDFDDPGHKIESTMADPLDWSNRLDDLDESYWEDQFSGPSPS